MPAADPGRRRLLLHAARACDGGKANAALEHARELRIGVAIELEQPHHRVVAYRRQPRRRPGQHRRGAAHHQRRHRTDREGAAAFGLTRPSGASPASARLSQPVSVAPGFGDAAFEHVLAVEMRALAIGRRRRVHDDRLPASNMRCRFGIAGLSAKKSSSVQRRRLAVEPQRIVAAQRDPVRIADRRHRRKSVERTAQHNCEEARVAAFGTRELRQISPGEQRARGEQQFAARWCMKAVMIISAGIPAPSAAASSACARLSRAGDGVARLGRRQRAEPGFEQRQRVEPLASAVGELVGDSSRCASRRSRRLCHRKSPSAPAAP